MRGMHVDNVDLNLVPALAALLEERQVSRAAVRMRLSQPAMSRVLARLRRQFDDDLLVRDGRGYRVTPLGGRLLDQLRDTLPALEQLFAVEAFDPATATQDYRLVGTDYAVLTFGHRLFAFLLENSPGSSLCFETWNPSTFDAVDDGTFDLIFYGADGPPGLCRELLFEDTFVCLVASDHPLVSAGIDPGPMGLDRYLEQTHLVVSVDDGLQPAIDGPLRTLGRPRRAGLTVPYHAAAARTVAGTGLVATVPARLVDSPQPGVVVIPAPHEVSRMRYSMIWSPRVTRDPAHAWLRQAVRESCAA